MKSKSKKLFIWSFVLLAVFVVYTICVKFVDVATIGPNGSSVGFSHINDFFHKLFGTNFVMYNITDWGGVVAFVPALIFAVVGVVQLFKRKKISEVDKNILALGIFYVLTAVVYLFFEFVVVNRRPVLIDGHLEASYPSSTTVLSLTFLLSVLHQLNVYVKNKAVRISLKVACIGYSAFLIVGRVVSGVHWFTDIFGAILISATLLLFYYALCFLFECKNEKTESEIKK